MKFNTLMITPPLLVVFHSAATGLSMLALVYYGIQRNEDDGVSPLIVLAPTAVWLVTRIVAECLVVVFLIHERLVQVEDNSHPRLSILGDRDSAERDRTA